MDSSHVSGQIGSFWGKNLKRLHPVVVQRLVGRQLFLPFFWPSGRKGQNSCQDIKRVI
jgi:hypothetical protein